MTYLNTKDGAQLFEKDWGTGQPVILIHGWPLSSYSWDAQAMAIADAGYRAIAYGRRGFGRSSQTWNGYDYDTLSDDLAAVIEYTEAQNAIIIGFSMGGGEVARYMSRHAGKSVAKVVLVSSIVPFRLKTADNPSGTEQTVFDETAQKINEDRAEFFMSFFRAFFGADTPGNSISEELLENMRNIAMQASLKATLECLKSFSCTDFRGDLAHFEVPTLIIHGTEDTTVPIEASARLAVKGIKDAILIEYPGAPHGLFATHREKFTQDLLTFIRQ
nr:alpha/beta hydrolase [uncultured Undibacterium sp.]